MKRMWSKEELKKLIAEQGGGGGGDVTASDIDSEEAAAGQVMTADGEGGASWKDASGGKLYRRRTRIDGLTTSGQPTIRLTLVWFSKSNTTYSTLSDFLEAMPSGYIFQAYGSDNTDLSASASEVHIIENAFRSGAKELRVGVTSIKFNSGAFNGTSNINLVYPQNSTTSYFYDAVDEIQ